MFDFFSEGLVEEISPQKANQLIKTKGAIIIDIRSPEEVSQASIPNAVNIPLNTLTTTPLPMTDILIFSCRSGRRTLMNQKLFKSISGNKTIYLMQGGIIQWQASGLPISS